LNINTHNLLSQKLKDLTAKTHKSTLNKQLPIMHPAASADCQVISFIVYGQYNIFIH